MYYHQALHHTVRVVAILASHDAAVCLQTAFYQTVPLYTLLFPGLFNRAQTAAKERNFLAWLTVVFVDVT